MSVQSDKWIRKESQKGILMATILKLIIPLIVVIPGIAAYVMVNDHTIMAGLGDSALQNIPSAENADKAYPWLLQFLPAGLKGLAFAALTAAIVSSLASMLNSTSTIFTMDIYKQYIRPNAGDKETVNTGRISAAVALLIAGIMAPLLGGIDQAFQLDTYQSRCKTTASQLLVISTPVFYFVFSQVHV